MASGWGGSRKGAGRKKGTREYVPRGTGPLIRAGRRAEREGLAKFDDAIEPEEVELIEPYDEEKTVEDYRKAEKSGTIVDEANGVLLQIMRGNGTMKHARDRMSAATFLIEQRTGRAKQKHEVTVRDQSDNVFQSEFADGSEVSSSEDPPRLPN